MFMIWYSAEGACCLQFLLCSLARLQDLTVRDLEKQEREKSANSLESFIFETQVREEYMGIRIPGMLVEVACVAWLIWIFCELIRRAQLSSFSHFFY